MVQKVRNVCISLWIALINQPFIRRGGTNITKTNKQQQLSRGGEMNTETPPGPSSLPAAVFPSFSECLVFSRGLKLEHFRLCRLTQCQSDYMSWVCNSSSLTVHTTAVPHPAVPTMPSVQSSQIKSWWLLRDRQPGAVPLNWTGTEGLCWLWGWCGARLLHQQHNLQNDVITVRVFKHV